MRDHEIVDLIGVVGCRDGGHIRIVARFRVVPFGHEDPVAAARGIGLEQQVGFDQREARDLQLAGKQGPEPDRRFRPGDARHDGARAPRRVGQREVLRDDRRVGRELQRQRAGDAELAARGRLDLGRDLAAIPVYVGGQQEDHAANNERRRPHHDENKETRDTHGTSAMGVRERRERPRAAQLRTGYQYRGFAAPARREVRRSGDHSMSTGSRSTIPKRRPLRPVTDHSVPV